MLAQALCGGMALVHVDGAPGGHEAAAGIDASALATARGLVSSVLASGAPAAAGGLVCDVAVALPGDVHAGHGGWIAALRHAADDAPPPAVAGQLAALARSLQAQCELALRDTRMARIAAQVPGVLYQYQLFPDGRTCFPYASEGLREIYRVAPEDVRLDASALLRIGHPDDLPRVLASIEQSARDLTPWECEYRVRFDDGVVQWLHGRAVPERLADGSTLWHGFIMPIDERKGAEQALARSEERFRHFFEAGLVGMTIARPDRAWAAVNHRMSEMLGYTAQEIERIDWADFTHPEDRAADEAQYARMAAGEIDGYVMDKRYLKKDGSVLECALAVRCERDEDGALRRVFAIVEDIDERRRAERALQAERDGLECQVALRTRELVAARDEAERANRAKSEFLASMSHELRTPLNAILGFAQLIELDRSLGPRSLAHLREVLRGGRHLLSLINEVLDLAQVESGRMAISPEALSLDELVGDALSLTAPLAAARRVTLRTELAPGLVVRADRLRLKQVLLNLLSNAVKYNRQGGDVRLSASPVADGRVRLEVHDTGPGLSPAQRAQLFQPFNRLGAEGGAVEGTGIGLALSRRLLALMGGVIDVDSEPGAGSCFWIELPRAELAAPPAPALPPGAGAPLALPDATVLYVEDNPANLGLVEQIVARHAGVRLISARSGPEGLATALAQAPALILLDIHLPGMDGYELLARLRADPRTRATPAVALTAQAMPSDARRAIEAGFDEYVAKPIDIAVFDAVLHRLLNRPA